MKSMDSLLFTFQLGQSFRSKHTDHTTAFEPGMVEASILASTRIEKGLPRLDSKCSSTSRWGSRPQIFFEAWWREGEIYSLTTDCGHTVYYYAHSVLQSTLSQYWVPSHWSDHLLVYPVTESIIGMINSVAWVFRPIPDNTNFTLDNEKSEENSSESWRYLVSKTVSTFSVASKMTELRRFEKHH